MTRVALTRTRAGKPAGIARVRQPVKDSATGKWRARYVDLEGAVRQAGSFDRKGDAVARTAAIVTSFNETGAASTAPTLGEFLDEWPEQFPKHPRTIATNTERIRSYVIPHLHLGEDTPLDELRRADLRAVQDALLRRRLAKTTIDGAFSSLSALLRDAVDVELIEANVAARMRVRPADPRLDPIRGPVDRRSVPPDEIRAFIAYVPPRNHALCWTAVLTGARPGELFAMDDDHLDRDSQMIYLHRTVDRYGHLMNGLKGTHHIADEAKRGRWTLFPRPLIVLLDLRLSTTTEFLYPSPRGKFWAVRNFYRNVWQPAQAKAGVAFTLYDLRHTFSSRLLSAGIPPVEISAWMGHSLRMAGHELGNTTTRVYAHATGEWREKALDVLAGLLDSVTSMPDGVIAIDDPRADDVRALLRRHLAYARASTKPEEVYALDVDALVDPAVTLFSYRINGEVLGVAALKHLDARHAEIKSMHTAEEARGRGIGRNLVDRLIVVARERGYQRLSLETGSGPAFAAARRLYRSASFTPCGPFGDYVPSSNSTYMTVSLDV